MTAIPRRMGHIWIGPKPAPSHWMKTWPELHPDWEYTIYDNDFLAAFPFRLNRHINEYFWRGLYAGVQDMMRYEILYAYGGFMADADAICKHPVDELLTETRAYTVWDRPEGDKFRAVCPILACEPGNAFVGRVIEKLLATEPAALRKAEVSTGNRFLGRMLKDQNTQPQDVMVWPMHYFLPWHKSDPDNYYSGSDTVYAEQQYGTSLWAYNKGKGEAEKTIDKITMSERRIELMDRLIGGQGRPLSPLRHLDEARIDAAHKAAEAARQVVKDDAFNRDVATLNSTLLEALSAAGADPRVHGLHYYRHMQAQPITKSKFKTRSIDLRAGLVGWLGSARRALVLGFDTAHLILHAHHTAPDVAITGVEGCRWYREKDPDPPKKAIYVPAAVAVLDTLTSGTIAMKMADETEFLAGLAADAKPFDLVIFCNADIRLLGLVPRLHSMLTKDAVVVLAAEDGDYGLSQAHRLMLQRLCYAPMDTLIERSGLGSYAAVRLIPPWTAIMGEAAP